MNSKYWRACIVCILVGLISTPIDAAFIPGDTHWENQWGPGDICVDDVWNPYDDPYHNGFPNPGKTEIIVAIIDTGIDITHEDLYDNLWRDENGKIGYDFGTYYNYDDDPGSELDHGTMLAGIVAAVTNNGKGIAGIAQISLMILKVCTDAGAYLPPPDDPWKPYDDAIHFAIDNGADIICTASTFTYDGEFIAPAQYLSQTIDYAYNFNGILVCSAIGNWINALDTSHGEDPPNGEPDFDECDYIEPYMDLDSILTVGATDEDGLRWEGSLYNDYIDVMAPGVDIYSTKFNGYDYGIGTSAAAPIVAGIAAILFSEQPGLTSAEVKNIIEKTTDDIIEPSGQGGPPPVGEEPQPGWDRYTGFGRVNCNKAFDLVRSNKRDWTQNAAEFSPVDYFSYTVESSDFEIDQNGYTHLVAINDEDPPEVRYYRFNPTGDMDTDISNLLISDNTKASRNPNIYIDVDNNIHIIWVVEHGDVNNDYIWYVKYNADMTTRLVGPDQIVGSNSMASPFHTVRLVVAPFTIYNWPTAFIFYDTYSSPTYKNGIYYKTIDKYGTISDYHTFVNTYTDEGGIEGGFDIDLSYASEFEVIHVVWQEFSGDNSDIKYWSMIPDGGKLAEEALVIADTANNEKFPRIDAQWENGLVHIVYEDWRDGGGPGTTRANQIIKYCVVEPYGDAFVLPPTQVGKYTDHHSLDDRGRNGKLFPSIAVSLNNIVTIVWREWDDDYSTGNDGYFSLYFCQYYVSYENYYENEFPYTVHKIFPRYPAIEEKDLYSRINYWEGQWDDLSCLVRAVDYKIRYPLDDQYCSDSHIFVLFQQKMGTGNYKYAMMSTRSNWLGTDNIGFVDQRECSDPDITIDELGYWHMVYASCNPNGDPQHSTWEIYYRNQYNLGNEIIVSGLSGEFLPDAYNSINPRIITAERIINGNNVVLAYIFWIDYRYSPLGELFLTIIQQNYQFAPPLYAGWQHKVAFLHPYDHGQSQHEIVFDKIGMRIHVIYRVEIPDELMGTRTTIHHGSITLFGNVVHTDSEIAGEFGYYFENPAIDIRVPDRKLFVVYTKRNSLDWDTYGDTLTEVIGPTSYMVSTYPFIIFDPLDIENSYYPDIKIDKPIYRNAKNQNNNVHETQFINVIWVEKNAQSQTWSLKYAKYYAFDEDRIPEIFDLPIQPVSYYESNNIPDPEMIISSENEISVIYSDRTKGYQQNPVNQDVNRLFFVSIDKLGNIKTTNQYISNNVNIVNSACDIDIDDRLYCVWDSYNEIQSVWGQTIYLRYQDGQIYV